jgi:hypothetical protein
MSLRLDFDFHGGGGFAIARKVLKVSLPSNYALRFHLRGDAPQNDFELKLVDPQGNVWWSKQRDFIFPSDWQQLVFKKPRFDFAWGPAGGGTPKRLAALEIAISASAGGKGSIWIDNLVLEPREASQTDAKPKVRSSTFVAGHEADLVVDQRADTSWRSGSVAADQWIQIDFTRRREYGGLVIDWDRKTTRRYQCRCPKTAKAGRRRTAAAAATAGATTCPCTMASRAFSASRCRRAVAARAMASAP